MNAPLFSVITVTLNDVEGLKATWESLSDQREATALGKTGLTATYEWIVVDGGSHDGSREWLISRQSALAWWRSEPDNGLYDAMNQGLAVAKGDYLLFLNAGDRLAAADTLARIGEALAEYHWPGFCYGDAWEHTAKGGSFYKRARHHRHAWYGMITHHQAMLYHRSVIAGLRYDCRYSIGADYAFTLEVLKRAQPHGVLRLPFPVCVFAIGGRSRRYAVTGRRDQDLIRQNLLKMGRWRRLAIRILQWLSFSAHMVVWPLRSALRCRSCIAATRYGFLDRSATKFHHKRHS